MHLDAADHHEPDERQPVRGVDAQHAPPPEANRARRRIPVQMRRHERPVQQEARYEKEHGDADVGAGEVPAPRAADIEARVEGDVREQHAHRRHGAKAVEQREPGGPPLGLGQIGSLAPHDLGHRVVIVCVESAYAAASCR